MTETTTLIRTLPDDAARAGSVAWTIDDGTNAESIRRLALFAAESGTRMTIFPVGSYPGWTEHAELFAPLVESGQIQVGNHTWSHTELTTLTDEQIVDELERNEAHFVGLWGVSTKPYFRPPNGPRDERTDAAAASAGWTRQVMWSGLLAEGPAKGAQELLASVDTEFAPGAVVIGHVNYEAMQEVLPDVLARLTAAGLASVTIRDAFGA